MILRSGASTQKFIGCHAGKCWAAVLYFCHTFAAPVTTVAGYALSSGQPIPSIERTGATTAIDAARLELLLTDLRLPAVKLMWKKLAEHEVAERGRRRIERHLAEARLPVGKTLATFDFEAVPMVSKAQVMALAAGDSWLEKGANLLLFGPPGLVT